jgi:predicted nucleic acid-binding protein
MIFVDTWAWIALSDKTDQYHSIAAKEQRRLSSGRETFVTSDFVLTEFINYLNSSVPATRAQAVIEALFSQVAARAITLVHVSPEQFQKAWELRKKYSDKPAISFTDFTSFVVMRDLSTTAVFPGDLHFQQVGMGFRILPELQPG